MDFSLWYHEGDGHGWPAIELRRREEVEDAVSPIVRRVPVDKDAYARTRLEQMEYFRLLMDPDTDPDDLGPVPFYGGEWAEVTENHAHTITRIFRDLHVFTDKGAETHIDVPEGAPNEPGTCSHCHFQPGTDAHLISVVGPQTRLTEKQLRARIEEHGFDEEKVLAMHGLARDFIDGEAVEIETKELPAASEETA